LKNESSNSHKVVADHIRSTSFLIADGITPENEGRGYVLRRILRRSSRFLYKHNIKEPFLYECSEVVCNISNDFPDLKKNINKISETIKTEEIKYLKTLGKGIDMIDEYLKNNNKLDADMIFTLYDTYGFPYEITEEIALEKKITLDKDGYEKLMLAQKERARGSKSFKDKVVFKLDTDYQTNFIGYDKNNEKGKVVAIYNHDNEVKIASSIDEKYSIILSDTCLYPEGGGQGAYGIAQWRGSRLDDLNAFAKANMPQEAVPPLTAKMNGKKPMSLLSFMQPDNSGMNLGQRLMKRDPTTGLNLFGRIGRGLDALVLPSSRMGDQITAQGAQRAEYEKGQLDVNNTIAFFEARAKEGDQLAADLLAAVRNKTIDAPTAMSMYYKEKFAKPDKTFTQMTGAQLNKERNTTSFDPKELYQVGSDGSVSEVKKKPLVDLGASTSKFNELDDKLLSSTGEIGLSAVSSLKRIDRLEALLGDMGGAATSIKAFAGRFGIPTTGLDEIQAAEALISSLVPLQRPAGSGPMSDADLALFKRSLPQLINTPEGNRLIIETMRGIAQYDAMGFDIIQEYRAGAIDKVEAFNRLRNRPDPTAWLKTSTSTFDNQGNQETLEIPDGPTITFSNPNQ
ncbi:MAG: alanine--tRNA ligase-related protein, partial [Porticoccaceae bacterium]